MKQITLWMLALFGAFQMNAQLFTLDNCGNNLGTTVYGPMNSVATANAKSRTAIIYPASQLTTLASQTLNTLYADRFTASGVMSGTPNFKIYMKEVPNLDWGTGALDWATATTGAVLVYDGNPSANIGNSAGWKAFQLTTAFLYSGTQNLAVFFEYSNPQPSIEIEWRYNYTNPCIVTGNTNTTKYSNSTAVGDLPTSLGSSNYRRPVLGFDFVVSCPAPSGLTLSNLDSNSVDLTWAAGGTESQWEYAVGPAGMGIPPTSTLIGSNTLTEIPLNPGTNYEIFVRSYCGTDDTSIWISTGSFATDCSDYDVFVENFDTYATGSSSPMPNCWAKLGTGSTYVQTGGVFPGTAPNRLYMTVTTSTFTHAVLPAVTNLSAGTHRLRFKAYATTANKTMQVGYQTDVLDATTFVSLQTIALPGTTAATAAEFTVLPTGVPAGIKNLVFRNGGGVATSLYIDDVIWEAIPTCLDVSQLGYPSISHNQATISWLPGGSETAWQYVYGEASVTDPTTLTPVDVATNPTATITPLLPTTTYKVWVRSNCGAGDLGIWIGPMFMTTQCPPVATYFENFDNYATGSTNPLADCWEKAGNGSVYINTGSLVPNSVPNRLYLLGNGAAAVPTRAFALMPQISNLQANTHRLKFKAHATTNDKTVDVGYLASASNLDSFVTISTLNLPGTTSDVAEEFIVVPTAIPAGINRLVFRNAGAVSTGVYVDDVIWEAIPVCQDVTNVTLLSISDTAATFNWTAGGSETAWQYVYGDATVTEPSALTPVDISITPSVTLGPLTPFSNYQIWIRSNCGSEGFGVWIGPFPFSTQCVPVAVFSENFDTSVTGAANPMTACWDRAGNGFTYITTASVAPASPPNRIYMSANGSAATPTQSFAIMPPVSNLQADSHRLRFTAYCSTANKQLEIGYFGSITDISTFVPIESVVLPSTAAATAQEFMILPNSIPAGVNRLVFRNAAATGSTTLYIDDVVWEAIPPCDDIVDIFAGNALSTTVNISWNPGGSETAWQYVYGPTTVTDPSTLTPFDVVDNPMTTVTLLQPSTTYRLWIRSNCGTEGVGNWSDPITITTTCAPVAEYSENFDSYPTGSGNPLPVCWTEFGTTGSVYITTGSVLPASPANRMYFSASGTTSTKAFAVLPPVSNLQSDTHRLKFKAYSTAVNSFIEIGYFENSADVNTFIVVDAVTLLTTTAATAMEYIVTPTFIPAGVESLVFRNIGVTTGTALIYVDDVVWEPIPSCGDTFGLMVMDLTNISAGFQWEPGDNITAWQYAYGPAALEDPSTLTPFDATNNPIGSASGLSPNTHYKYWVRSNCGNGNYGNWSVPFTFVTDCNTTTEFSENFDSYATGTTAPMPDCWKRAGNANTYINTGSALPATAPNRLYMIGNGSTTTESFAIMPPVSNLQAGTHRLRFKAYATTVNKYLEVGYFGDTSDISTFVLLETINLPGTNAASAQEFILDPGSLPAGISSLVFRNPGIPSGSTVLYIDDVFWEAIPVTVPGCATNIVATVNPSCGNFATLLAWNAGTGTADGYLLTVGTTPGGSDVLNNENLGNVNSYAVEGNFGVTYFFKIVPYNSFGNAADCAEQSFTTGATGCYCTSVPTTNSNSGITNVQLGTNNFLTGDVTYFDHSTLAVDIEQGLDASLHITFGTNITYNTNVWIDMNDNFNFESDEIFFQGESSTTNPNTLDASFFVPDNAPLGNHRMRIGTANTGQLVPNPCYSGSQGVTLDFNVNVIAPDLSTGDFNASGLMVYPNPVQEVLSVSHSGTISEVSVFNLLGQQILLKTAVNANQVQVDMSELASGTYLIRVISESQIKAIKVFKQ